jgi:hypothetical protein
MEPEPDTDRDWRRLARVSGYLTAGGFFAGTVLYLLDATDALGAGPELRRTAAGPLHDEASFWVAYFGHQHHILWSIVGRDTLLPLGFVALVVLSLAIRRAAGADRPDAQLMTTLFVVGGIFAALSDLLYLAATDYWRVTGWTAGNAAGMVAVGRSSAAIQTLSRWPEAAGFVVLASALVCLGRLCGRGAALPSRARLVAYLAALVLVGAAIGETTKTDAAYDAFSAVAGLLVAPTLAVWLGRHLGAAPR